MFNEKTHSLKMDKAIEVFSKELSSLRTGRANAAMLDLIKVDVYGQQMPINQIGSITTPEPRMINIQVWDQSNVSLETKDNSETVKTFGKQLSMHIAASNPLALESKLIDKAIIDKEQELVTEELKNSGKPEEIAKKISLGKMKKFKEENALLTQAWVMEPKKKVQDVLKELAINDLKIKEFSRIKIGE